MKRNLKRKIKIAKALMANGTEPTLKALNLAERLPEKPRGFTDVLPKSVLKRLKAAQPIALPAEG